jgi:hypothetical protein
MKNPGRVFKIKCPEKKPRETGGSFWTALAERSGDSAFVWTTRAGPKRRRAPLAAAVQNVP